MISRSGHSTTVDDRIASARGCAYSLMGAGLHGEMGAILGFHCLSGRHMFYLVLFMVLTC